MSVILYDLNAEIAMLDGTFETFIWLIIRNISSFFSGLEVINSKNFHMISYSRSEQIIFVEKSQLKIIHKILNIDTLYLIRQIS